eukprot:g826.t1
MREKSRNSTGHASSRVPSRRANSWRRRKSKGAALHWRCTACGSLNKTEPLASAHVECRICGEHRAARQKENGNKYEGYFDDNSSTTSEGDSDSNSEHPGQETWNSTNAATAAARQAREAANAARQRANAARKESAARRRVAEHEAELAREQRAQAWRARSEAKAEAEATAAHEAEAQAKALREKEAKIKAEEDWEARARDWRKHAEASHGAAQCQAEPVRKSDTDIDTDVSAKKHSNGNVQTDADTDAPAADVDEAGMRSDSTDYSAGQQAYTRNNAADVDDDPTQWEGWEQWTNGTLSAEQAEAWASQWTDSDEREWAEWEHSARANGWSTIDISAARHAALGAPPDAPDTQPDIECVTSSGSTRDPAALPTGASVGNEQEYEVDDKIEDGVQQEMWYEQGDGEGNVYYVNSLTGESKWECDLEWIDYMTAEGDIYYLHIPTGVSQWDMPQAFVPIMREERQKEIEDQDGHVAANKESRESEQEDKREEEKASDIDNCPRWKGQRALDHPGR